MNEIDSTILDVPVYKRIDDPWIALLVLSILIFVLSAIAIPVLYFFCRRYRQSMQSINESYILSNKPTGRRQIPIQIDDQTQVKIFQ
jgi:hydrogenase-4 membrane subunit HyfE